MGVSIAFEAPRHAYPMRAGPGGPEGGEIRRVGRTVGPNARGQETLDEEGQQEQEESARERKSWTGHSYFYHRNRPVLKTYSW